MHRQLTAAATMLVCVLFYSSCKNQESGNVSDTTLPALQSEAPEQPQETSKQKIPTGTNQQVNVDSAGTQNPLATKPTVDWDKKIIKTANLNLEVKDFTKYNTAVHQTVKQFGGYIAQEEQTISTEKTATAITIKVPVDQFEGMMNQLPGGDTKVLERKITTEDVTGQVVDIKSRLESKKQMRLKYLDFLKQSKNMEEVLQVQGEINSIQEEIEAAATRVEYLTHQSAMSTINLSFYQPLEGFKPADGPPSFFTRMGESLKAGATWITDLVVALTVLWPLMLVGGLAFFIIRKLTTSKKKLA